MIEVVRGSWQTHLAMALWVPIVLVMFATLPPRRALLAAFMIAWMFLPIVRYTMPLLPDINKMTITVFSVFLGILLFDTNAFMRFKPSWYDLPVLVLILSPIVTSTSVGLGLYDGVSWARAEFITIGLPYLYGRIYLMSPQGMKELAIA